MFHYEGVSTLKIALQTGDEKSLARFPYEEICKKLGDIIRQPSEMEISNEIKCKQIDLIFVVMAIQCIAQIIDIFP